jgi:hypothetical protein
LCIGVSDLERSKAFYDNALKAIGIELVWEYRPMAAPFVEHELADRSGRADGGLHSFRGV